MARTMLIGRRTHWAISAGDVGEEDGNRASAALKVETLRASVTPTKASAGTGGAATLAASSVAASPSDAGRFGLADRPSKAEAMCDHSFDITRLLSNSARERLPPMRFNVLR